MRLFAVAIVGLVVSGCAASTHKVAALEREAPPTPSQIADRHTAMAEERRMTPNEAEKFDIAVVGGRCAPKALSDYAVVSCVHEKPCNGFGRRMADGRVLCACFTTEGGCPEGTYCNVRTRECTKASVDPFHAQ